MKGQTELSEFMLKLIATMLFTVFLVGGILAISQFKVQVNENAVKRLSIDFGENVLAAPCLTEEKGLFNKSRIDKEISYGVTHTEDMDGISCLDASVAVAGLIRTGNNKWFFGSSTLKPYLESSEFEFPAAMNDSDGKIIPAKLYVAVSASNDCNSKNNGFNCYNCLEEEDCKKGGCRWDGEACKP